MPAPALLVSSVGKSYPIANRLRDLFAPNQPHERLWAVRDVSLALPRGGSLAVLGSNGAGKSTLLRLLGGLSAPSAGEVQVSGRRACLLDLGAGLIADWTGEENARAALSLFGTGREKLSFVREFSDLGAAMNRPIRGYSAGMQLRLAYAVAVASQPEVLIADEIIGVGDEAFQRKCAHFIAGFLASGRTLVLATHNLYLAEKLCDSALWLERGEVLAQGPCGSVTRVYRERAAQGSAGGAASESGGVVSGRSTGLEIRFGDPFEVSFDVPRDQRPLALELSSEAGLALARQVVPWSRRYALRSGFLLPGRYRLRMVAGEGAERTILAERRLVCRGERRDLGSIVLPHRWLSPGAEPASRSEG